MTRWGASPEEWQHFSDKMGLTADLLPVVSNPQAVISGASKMATLGKTPSVYNSRREVAGVANWTSLEVGEPKITQWSREADYGICIQTRRLRAIDIDIDDPVCAAAVREVLSQHTYFPMRMRSNSGKCLLVFDHEGDLTKRMMKVNGGLIELLATGQQFIAAGTHPSGVKYIWVDDLPNPDHVPYLTLEQVNALWADLETKFAIEPAVTSAPSVNRTRTKGIHYADQISNFLRASPFFRADDQDGRVNLWCPWQAGHSSDSGESATTYFPAGSHGIDAGHFKCLHASCSGRRDGDFIAATGYGLDGFDVLSPLPAAVTGVPLVENIPHQKLVVQLHVEGSVVAATNPLAHTLSDDLIGDMPDDLANNVVNVGPYAKLPLPDTALIGALPLVARRRDGSVIASVTAAKAFVARSDVMGFAIAQDAFRDEILLGSHTQGWQRLDDTHITVMRERLEGYGFTGVPHDLVRAVVHTIAKDNSFDSAQIWLDGWQWDGVPRIEAFFSRYMGASDTPYSRALSLYMWSALAGRIIEPAVKADIVPVLVAPGGTGKTSMVEVLAPDMSMFVEISLGEKDSDLSRKVRGKVIGEIAELRGLHTREMEGIKAWVSRRYEEHVKKYVETASMYARRFVCIGTTDKDEFLANEANNRRWAPIKVMNVDLQAIKQDRGQLWAEGAELFRGNTLVGAVVPKGVQWVALNRLLSAEHEQYVIGDDVWESRVMEWLERPDAITGLKPENAEYLTINVVLEEALGLAARGVKMGEMYRAGRVLRKLGYEKIQKWIDGKPKKVWVLFNLGKTVTG